MYEFDFTTVVTYIPELISGVLVTIELTIISLAVGIPVGLMLALARISGRRWLAWPAYVYIEFFRTTPPFVQIVWAYFVLPVITGWELSAFQAAGLALGFNIAAFLGEVFRAGIQAIDRTQFDAGRVLGLSRVDVFRYIISPQAIRIVLPPSGTTVMLLIKGTSIASALGVLELTRIGQLVTTETFHPFEILTVVAIIYFALTYPIALLTRFLERRYSHGFE